MREIIGILVKHGFGALVTRLDLTEAIGIRHIMRYGEEGESPYVLPKRLRISIEELGPTFIKLGQIMSTRPDLVGPEFIDELQGLQDNVSPMPWGVVASEVEASLGGPIGDAFEYFSEQPLASASVAQVHRATLKDGTDVAVKVRRADIQKPIQSDLNILHFLAARVAQVIPELALLNPVGIIQEFDRALNLELDFTYERRNLERFRREFLNFEGVRVPQIYADFCSPTLLVMDFIDGVKVTEAQRKFGADPYAMARTMLRALLKMVFRDGVFHGDLHPGNILVSEDHVLNLIDFGLVGRLLPRQRQDIIDVLIGIGKEDYELIARVFFDLGVKVPGEVYDYNEFESDVGDVIERHLAGQTLENIEVQGFLADLIAGCLKHNIKMPQTYTMVFKALITVEGIGRTLSPKINLIDEAKPFIEEMLLDRYSPERLFREMVETLTNTSTFLRKFAQTAPRLLRDLEHGRLLIQVDSDRLVALNNELRRTGNRLTRALLFGSCLITATMALNIPGPTILGIHALAFAAYAVGAVAGLPLLWSLLWRR